MMTIDDHHTSSSLRCLALVESYENGREIDLLGVEALKRKRIFNRRWNHNPTHWQKIGHCLLK